MHVLRRQMSIEARMRYAPNLHHPRCSTMFVRPAAVPPGQRAVATNTLMPASAMATFVAAWQEGGGRRVTRAASATRAMPDSAAATPQRTRVLSDIQP